MGNVSCTELTMDSVKHYSQEFLGPYQQQSTQNLQTHLPPNPKKKNYPKIAPFLAIPPKMVSSLHHQQLFFSPTRLTSKPKATNPLITFAKNTSIRYTINNDKSLLPSPLKQELMPKHVAVIMDGNRRWAKMKGYPIGFGYEAGVKAFKNLVDLCCNWGINVLTVFAFSSDNWFRPKVEVDILMGLMEIGLRNELEDFMRAGIRMSIIGDSSKLPKSLQDLIDKAVKTTKENTRLHLVVAVNYSGQNDVVQACQNIAQKVKDGIIEPKDINSYLVEKELQTSCSDFPCPDLLIRTSGELRLSNFLLWQLAYTELYFSHLHWPDFGESEFLEALCSFQQRQRRYGRQSF